MQFDCKLLFPEHTIKFSPIIHILYNRFYHHELIHVAINRFFHSICYVRLVVAIDGEDLHGFTHYETTHHVLVLFAILFHFLYDFFSYHYQYFFQQPLCYKNVKRDLYAYKLLFWKVFHPRIVME